MTDLCFECPISSSCGGCLAVGHQIIGTPDRKTTFHCVMKYAEALANWYYFNNLIIKHPDWDIDVRQCKLPKNRVLKIISEDEYEFLKYLEIMAIIVKMEYHNKGGESS
jgi:radical SAM domain protein